MIPVHKEVITIIDEILNPIIHLFLAIEPPYNQQSKLLNANKP